MRDIEEYIKSLKITEVIKYTEAILGIVGDFKPNKEYVSGTVTPMIEDLIKKLEDIDRADFTENFNPNHREENPF